MKAKIEYDSLWHRYRWTIYFSNGSWACESAFYTRRDNAIRGLRNFVEKMWTTKGIEKIMDTV